MKNQNCVRLALNAHPDQLAKNGDLKRFTEDAAAAMGLPLSATPRRNATCLKGPRPEELVAG
jgi:hypothetical protein